MSDHETWCPVRTDAAPALPLWVPVVAAGEPAPQRAVRNAQLGVPGVPVAEEAEGRVPRPVAQDAQRAVPGPQRGAQGAQLVAPAMVPQPEALNAPPWAPVAERQGSVSRP
jgi:hypothetical protein